MSSHFILRPDRVLAIACAIFVTCITFSSTVELLGDPPGGDTLAPLVSVQAPDAA
jgi:hypothetical protein